MFLRMLLGFLCLLFLPRHGFADDNVTKFYSINEKNQIDFNISPNFKAQLIQNVGLVTLQCQGQEIQNITQIGNIPGEKFPIQIDDFNFDGFADVALGESTGYMGVNWFFTIYFFNPENKKFEKEIEGMGTYGSIQINKNQKEISGLSKSGPSVESISYRFKKGKPYIYRQQEIGSKRSKK